MAVFVCIITSHFMLSHGNDYISIGDNFALCCLFLFRMQFLLCCVVICFDCSSLCSDLVFLSMISLLYTRLQSYMAYRGYKLCKTTVKSLLQSSIQRGHAKNIKIP